MKGIVQFCKECVAELKKVTWPTGSEVISSVKIVLITTIFLALVLGFFDWAFTQGLRLVF